METLLEVAGLSKHFGPVVAVDDVSCTVQRGEVLGFLGPNGAGKSTTMKMITGYLAPSAGTAVVCGHDVTREPIEVKSRLGYLPEGAPAYGDMTPRGLLRFVARVRGLDAETTQRRIDAVVGRLGLHAMLHRPIETLSKGFKRRVGLAQALLTDPQVLILDEPTDGLDPNQKHEVRELLQELAAEKAIVISTHILEEVEAVCTRAIIIDRGRIVADAEPEDLLARSGFRNAVGLRLPLQHADQAEAVLRGLKSVARVLHVRQGRKTAQLLVFPAGDADVMPAVRQTVIEVGAVGTAEVYQERGRLDDVFRDLTVPA